MNAHHIKTANDVARELKRMNAMLHGMQQALGLFPNAAEDDLSMLRTAKEEDPKREAV